MAGYVITGEESGVPGAFIPRNARYSVYAIDGKDESIIIRGTASGRSIIIDPDDGKYRVKVFKPGVANWGYEFFVGVTKEQWRLLTSRKTTWQMAKHTTEGIRWTCKLCLEKSMTRVAAVKHEWLEHRGIDPMTASEEEIDEGLATFQQLPDGPVSVGGPIPALGRRPGRPRKNPVEEKA